MKKQEGGSSERAGIQSSALKRSFGLGLLMALAACTSGSKGGASSPNATCPCEMNSAEKATEQETPGPQEPSRQEPSDQEPSPQEPSHPSEPVTPETKPGEEPCPAMGCRYEPCPPGVEPPKGCASVCGCMGMSDSLAPTVQSAPPPQP